MIVMFTTQSEKKALDRTRRILDNYANRVGDNTWITPITEAGLETIKMVLKRKALKNMAVACYRMAGRRIVELLWIVGNRSYYSEDGLSPVSTTSKDLMHTDWENHWQYLSILKPLAALSLLLHDWGKSSDYFQAKLRKNSIKGDPYRHEWVSCKLIEAMLVSMDSLESDKTWLSEVSKGNVDTSKILAIVDKQSAREWGRLKRLPPIASFMCWLIMSHHRLPLPTDADGKSKLCETFGKEKTERKSFEQMMKSFTSDWGYTHSKEITEEDKKKCFTFSCGLLWDDCHHWKKQVKKWSGRLLEKTDVLSQMIETGDSAFRLLANMTRLCMMLSDHYCSSSLYTPSKQDTGIWNQKIDLWANTNRVGERNQWLEEHLVCTCKQALLIAHRLPAFETQMEAAHDIKSLAKSSPAKFSWQDKAVRSITREKDRVEGDTAWFVVNMASTGCGKTIANAKIVRALSKDGKSLRYILALGLRSLTLQTGDSYKDDLHIDEDDLAVLIGSSAIRALHEEDRGSESAEEILPEQVAYVGRSDKAEGSFLDIILDSNNSSAKAFLYKPILCTTVDHMMGAVTTKRGGRYMMPYLRLMSSDLVIDEIDDFAPEDLYAISRLVHLAGMLGRNVGISSATIPQDLAEALYKSYTAGLQCYNSFFGCHKKIRLLFCDEFRSVVHAMSFDKNTEYMENHKKFVEKRVASLQNVPVKRKAFIQPCTVGEEMNEYYGNIQEAILRLQKENYIVDKTTGKKVSFGLVRMANINPCVDVSKYLMHTTWPDDIDVKVLCYHSRQILLLRHVEEKYLDAVLRRKYDDNIPVNITDTVIRQHLAKSKAHTVLFILVSTPVEEVGRDHDFDWAVIEPSSYRSIIQLSGRIRRHRPQNKDINHCNVAVIQYNKRGIENASIAFTHPGFEGKDTCIMKSHDMELIGNPEILASGINSIPRIKKREILHPQINLCDLEQQVMVNMNNANDAGPASIPGWIYEYWWMSAVPLVLKRFRRDNTINHEVYIFYNGKERTMKEYDGKGWVPCQAVFQIKDEVPLTDKELNALWLNRDYIEELEKRATRNSLEEIAKKYGELVVPEYKNGMPKWLYSDTFGLYKDEGSEDT